MENDHRYFENRECRYYPCHKGKEHINCLFCYCPLYNMQDCPGSPCFVKKDKGYKKVCTACSFPHEAANYDRIMEILKGTGYFTKEQTEKTGNKEDE